jgi:hypothetical protein
VKAQLDERESVLVDGDLPAAAGWHEQPAPGSVDLQPPGVAGRPTPNIGEGHEFRQGSRRRQLALGRLTPIEFEAITITAASQAA